MSRPTRHQIAAVLISSRSIIALLGGGYRLSSSNGISTDVASLVSLVHGNVPGSRWEDLCGNGTVLIAAGDLTLE